MSSLESRLQHLEAEVARLFQLIEPAPDKEAKNEKRWRQKFEEDKNMLYKGKVDILLQPVYRQKEREPFCRWLAENKEKVVAKFSPLFGRLVSIHDDHSFKHG